MGSLDVSQAAGVCSSAHNYLRRCLREATAEGAPPPDETAAFARDRALERRAERSAARQQRREADERQKFLDKE
eukprot:9817193-Alexandrium_andersonii.AAC.1